MRCIDKLKSYLSIKTYLIIALGLSLLFAMSLTALAFINVKTVALSEGEIVTIYKTQKETLEQFLNENAIHLSDNDYISEEPHFILEKENEIKIRRAVAVSFSQGDEWQSFISSAETVAKALAENGVHLRENDRLAPPGDAPLAEGMRITLKRSAALRFILFGDAVHTRTAADTVSEFLDENGISPAQGETLSPPGETPISPDMVIEISRTSKEIISEQEEIPYKVVRRPNNNLAEGVTKEVQAGKNGVCENQYEITAKNGEVINRVLKASKTITKPVDAIIEYSEINTSVTSRGENLRYTKKITATATAYDLSYASTGKTPNSKYYGVTASGMKARVGVVAVDPRVIPLGTRLYIESSDGGKSWVYGYCVAGDTGGAIKGNRVDLFFDTAAECKKFGRKSATVYILE